MEPEKKRGKLEGQANEIKVNEDGGRLIPARQARPKRQGLF
jgi:hypothetical protein